MRLTAEVLARCPQITNALNLREVDMRGRALTLLDEAPLAQLADSFDVLNFSDNALTTLDGIPPMPRVTAVIAHRNQLQKIHPKVFANLQNVDTFAADCNAFANPVELARSLSQWKELRRVTVDGNPVMASTGEGEGGSLLRSLLVLLCPKLFMINYERITDAERERVRANAGFLRERLREGEQSSSVGPEKTRKRGRAAAAAAVAASCGVNNTPLHAQSGGQPAVASGASTGGGAADEDDEEYTQALYARIDAAETEEELLRLNEELDARQQRRTKAQRK